MTTWNRLSYKGRSAVHKLYHFYKNNGSRETLSVSGNSLFKDVVGVTTPITMGIPFESNEVKMLTYKDREQKDVVLFADGGKLKKYDGTQVSHVALHAPTTDEQTDPGQNELINLINFRCFAMKKDRIFAAAHPAVKNRVSFCHHDQSIGYAVYDYWPAPFFFDVAVEDNDEIVELKVFRDALIIFCKRSIWALYGNGITLADYELKKINVPKGCISPKSIQEVGNDLFYLADDHVFRLYSTDESYISASPVSVDLEKTFKGISRLDKAKAVATYFDDKYILSLPDGTCLVFDVILKSWTKWTNIQANSFLDKDGVLLFSSNDGVIYEFKENVYHDDYRPVKFVMKSKIMDFGMDVQQKKFRRLWVIAKQYDGYNSSFDLKGMIDHFGLVELTENNLDVETNIAGKWDEALWDEALWDFAEVIQQELRIKKKGKNIQIVISNEKEGEPLTIYGLAFEFKPKKP